MLQPLDRRNTTALGRWWFTVDRGTLFAVFALIFISLFLVMAAGPPEARRVGYPDFYFVQRQQIFLALGTVALIGVSMLDTIQIRRLAFYGFLGSLLLMFMLYVPGLGVQTKGAVRWIRILGLSIQPSEFVKPCLAVVLAWVFSLRFKQPGFPAYRIAAGIYAVVAALLITQPDFGMTMTVSGMFMVQFFLAGMPFVWVAGMMVGAVLLFVGAYHLLPHVASRIDRFMDPASGDNYQVQKSLEAFRQGSWLGRGPGEGVIKMHIPDSHTDFIFSVAGEEFGMLACLVIVGIFAFIVVRGFVRLAQEQDMFRTLAVGGLLTQFGIQAIVNMGVAVNLLPAKGMTLPFLSYGGSSLVAMAGGIGMMLALTRKRYGQPREGQPRGNVRYQR